MSHLIKKYTITNISALFLINYFLYLVLILKKKTQNYFNYYWNTQYEIRIFQSYFLSHSLSLCSVLYSAPSAPSIPYYSVKLRLKKKIVKGFPFVFIIHKSHFDSFWVIIDRNHYHYCWVRHFLLLIWCCNGMLLLAGGVTPDCTHDDYCAVNRKYCKYFRQKHIFQTDRLSVNILSRLTNKESVNVLARLTKKGWTYIPDKQRKR